LPIFPDAKHPGEYADYPADRASQHTADRSGRLIARLRSLLNALDQPLRVYVRSRVKKGQDNCPNRETQSELRTRGGSRTDHHFISMVDLDWGARRFGRCASVDAGTLSFFGAHKSTARTERPDQARADPQHTALTRSKLRRNRAPRAVDLRVRRSILLKSISGTTAARFRGRVRAQDTAM
jgi:hypothetical protein